MKAKFLTDEQLKSAFEMYASGLSFFTISKNLGYSTDFIRKLLIKNGLISRKLHEINRKHIVNEDYFDVIDTEEKAYFLGFLFSDGNVNKKYNSIVLKLQKDDKDILVRFSHAIINKELLYKSENNLLVKFSSYHIKNQLIALGCPPAKSLILRWPTWLIDQEMQRHFIRGYFDGDGCLNEYINGRIQDYYVNMISTDSFCRNMMATILAQINVPGKIIKDQEMLDRGNLITSILLYQGNRKVLKLMKWLYKDATIYLERKHDIFLRLATRIEDIDRRFGNRYVNEYLTPITQ